MERTDNDRHDEDRWQRTDSPDASEQADDDERTTPTAMGDDDDSVSEERRAQGTASLVHEHDDDRAGMQGADEQGTAPEDRDAAAAADRWSGTDAADAPRRSEYTGNGSGDRFDLYDGTDTAELRRRWDTVQAGFVDDPKRSAEEADTLVGELVDRIGQRRQQLRDELGRQTDQPGGETEAMRHALRQYRELFQALVRD